MTGTILEIRWTAKLEEDLARWIAEEAQLPRPAAEDFTTREMIGAFLQRSRGQTHLAIRSLGRLLERHSAGAIDSDLAAACQSLPR